MEKLTYFLMVRLDKEMETKLKEMAKQERLSIADFVRDKLFQIRRDTKWTKKIITKNVWSRE